MSDLKPIEEGCLAISVNCSYLPSNGKFVRVIRKIPRPPNKVDDRGEIYWEVDREFVYISDIDGRPKNKYNFLPDMCLLRIDDPDLEEESEEELVYIEDNQDALIQSLIGKTSLLWIQKKEITIKVNHRQFPL